MEDIVINLRALALTKADSTLQKTCNDAADMLEFIFNEMQVYSPSMDGQHRWRMRGGWPMNQLAGSSPEAAIRHAIQSVSGQQRL
jgi:hypothetical protein